MRKILVGTDTSAGADLAVQEAARLAERDRAELLILHVRGGGGQDVADPRKSANPGRYLEEMSRRFPRVRVRAWSEEGAAAERIVDVAEAERVDAIVLGNRGTRGSWWRVRESVPNIVLRHAPCSVYIVDTRAAQ